MATGKLLHKFSFGGYYVKIMPDQKSLIVASSAQVKKIDINSGTVLKIYQTAGHTLAGPVVVSHNGKLLAANTVKCQAVLFDAETGEMISTTNTLSGGDDYSWVKCINFTPDDQYLLVGESKKKSFLKIKISDMTVETGETGSSPLSIAANGKYLLIGRLYGFNDFPNLIVRNITTKEEVFLLDKHSVTAFISHPTNNELVATGTIGTLKGGVGLWDLSKRKLKIMKGHMAEITDLEFTSDGKYIVSASGDRNRDQQDFTVRLWDVEKMKQIRIFEE